MLTAAFPTAYLRRLDERAFLQCIFDTVAKRELHEVEEWLGQGFEGEPDGWVRAHSFGKPLFRRRPGGDASKEFESD